VIFIAQGGRRRMNIHFMVFLFLTSQLYTFNDSFIAMMLHGNLKNKMQFKMKATNKNEEKYQR